jgi:hypothetical protein
MGFMGFSQMNVREQIANLSQDLKKEFLDLDLLANLVAKRIQELERDK